MGLIKVCRVKPMKGECLGCVDRAIDACVDTDCDACEHKRELELLNVGKDFLGRPYGIVLRDGKAEVVALHRLYDIRDIDRDEFYGKG